MHPTQPSPEDLADIAEKVRTGEYFREARRNFDLSVHDPMSERYFYVLITGVALFILLITVIAMQSLYPLQSSVPFIYSTNNIVEDRPRMKSLIETKGEDAGEAMLRFLVKNYVVFRESYNIDTLDRSLNAIKSQSSPEVFRQFQRVMDPHNAESPIILYQRHTKRTIAVVQTKRLYDEAYDMEVVYEATLESKSEIKKSRWLANIAFSYSGIALDQKTEKVKPVEFVVTKYSVKKIQDLK